MAQTSATRPAATDATTAPGATDAHAAPTTSTVDRTPKPSFTKGLFLGQIQSELVMPFPLLAGAERARVDAAVASARDYLSTFDVWKAEEQGWVGDDVIRDERVQAPWRARQRVD